MAPSQIVFEFVSVTSSDPVLSADSRALVKKHVMKDIGLARRKFMPRGSHDEQSDKGPSKPNATRYSLANNKAPSSEFTKYEAATENAQDLELLCRAIILSSKPSTWLSAARIDPFASFPIPGNTEVDILIDHINDDSHASFKLFREYWFPLAIQDPATFHCTLALAAQHRTKLYSQDSRERAHQARQYVSHYAAAIRSVKDRVGDPAQNTGDDMIAAIILLACDHASSNAAANYMQHMKGLDAIIQLRGGIETLEPNKKLRLLLFWIDTIGASALNLSPRFPAPTRYLPEYESTFQGHIRPRLPNNVSEEWAAAFPSQIELVRIFDDLCALTVTVEKEALQRQAVQDPRFTGFYVLPLVHRLFTLQLENPESDLEKMVFEACKLSAFLYLQQLRHFVAKRYPCLKEPFFEAREEKAATLASSCVLRLELIMFGHDAIWTTLQPLKCWVLTIGANSSYMMPGLPSHLVDLEILASSSNYGYWCNSMGPLIDNSWTHTFYKAA